MPMIYQHETGAQTTSWVNEQCVHPSPAAKAHANSFSLLNGYPYLVNRYLDQTTFRQIDTSIIQDSIEIEHTGSMHTTVDVVFDLTGSRTPNVDKYEHLKTAIATNLSKLNKILPVIDDCLSIQINFQIENSVTGDILHKYSERLYRRGQEYYLKMKTGMLDEDVLFTNTNGVAVVTINQRVYGADALICRLTSINFDMTHIIDPDVPVVPDETGKNMNAVWTSYYHWANNGSDVVLHPGEISVKTNKFSLVHLGSVQINRSFPVTYAHKLMFKISLWQNDMIFVDDTTAIANIMDVYDNGGPQLISELIQRIDNEKRRNDEQDFKIEVLESEILGMKTTIGSLSDQLAVALDRISEIERSFDEKADQSEVDQLSFEVSTKVNRSDIETIVSDLDSKATIQSVSDLDTKISTLNTSVYTITNDVDSITTDVSGLTSQVSTIQQDLVAFEEATTVSLNKKASVDTLNVIEETVNDIMHNGVIEILPLLSEDADNRAVVGSDNKLFVSQA